MKNNATKTRRPTVAPKWIPSDFDGTVDNAMAAERYRIAQARQILEAPIVRHRDGRARKVPLVDGTFRYLRE